MSKSPGRVNQDLLIGGRALIMPVFMDSASLHKIVRLNPALATLYRSHQEVRQAGLLTRLWGWPEATPQSWFVFRENSGAEFRKPSLGSPCNQAMWLTRSASHSSRVPVRPLGTVLMLVSTHRPNQLGLRRSCSTQFKRLHWDTRECLC